MANTIIQKRSDVAGARPIAAQLAVGEIAVNTADGKAYTRTEAGAVVELTEATLADGSEIAAAVATDAAGNQIAPITYTENGQSYVAHIFTQSGALNFTTSVPVEYLIVAGGGGGGLSNSSPLGGGGGGAGGLVTGSIWAPTGNQTVVVGAGGAAATAGGSAGVNGSNSTFSTFSAVGGGGGGGQFGTPGVGGSGGGRGARTISLESAVAGTPGQGNAGGARNFLGVSGGAGGGGAGAAGESINASQLNGHAGGAGLQSSLSGVLTYYAGGGGGGRQSGGVQGAGGPGGGGSGGADGQANTGGGGGGANVIETAGTGGSGVVIVRYSPAAFTPLQPDAQDWLNRIYSNGGTISATTASALSNFCAAVSAAGIRDRFYRLNLFAGNNLNACLVPLYRGPSLAGTQYGNTTDTNINFVSGDYQETGAIGGLTNTTTKRLNTGLMPDAVFSVESGHLAYYGAQWTPSPTLNPGSLVMGAVSASNSDRVCFFGRGNSGLCAANRAVLNAQLGSAGNGFVCHEDNNISAGFYVGSRLSSTRGDLYRNGASIQFGSGTNTYTGIDTQIMVFNASYGATVLSGAAIRMMAYSAGVGMTATQVAAYNAAMQAFQAALDRAV
jgi:hypothetical protein